MKEKVRLIITRKKPVPHLEVHYADHVEFWSREGKLISRHGVEVYKPEKEN